MKMCGRYIFSSLLMVLFNCSPSDDAPSISVFSASFDFNESPEGWDADFAGFHTQTGDSSFYELRFEYTDLPDNLSPSKSLLLSGHHQDALFMYLKKKITGLMPNTSYNLVFEVELASNGAEGAAGGLPGENIYLKAGASEVEPKKIVHSGEDVLNFDKGNQSEAGNDVIVLGNITATSTFLEYTLFSWSNASSSIQQPFIARSNEEGEIWLVVGTDSDFEGKTTVYYTKVNVVFSASN